MDALTPALPATARPRDKQVSARPRDMQATARPRDTHGTARPRDTTDREVEALWLAVAGSGVRSLAVAAARPAEGATTLAEALTRRAALSGRRVLYADLSGGHGGAAEDAVVAGAQAGIGRLAAPSDASLLAWRDPVRLAAQAEAWWAEWDLVILDAAPLLDEAPAGVPPLSVAAAAEATIMLVLSGRTAASDVREAQQRLDRAGARLLGTVMNDRDNPSLLAEMEREAARFARISPRLAGWMRDGLRHSRLLAQRS